MALYIPSEEEIQKLQKIREANDINKVDIYGYLVAKAIEKLIVNYHFLRYKDISVTEIPEVIHGVCYLYPKELFQSEYAKYDADLCHAILNAKHTNELNQLENLGMFAPSVQFNRTTINIVLELLDEKLNDNPTYRFTYSKCQLLDAIFDVDYQAFLSEPHYNMEKLIHLDPIYAIKFPSRELMPYTCYSDERITNFRLGSMLDEAIRKYKKRYDLGEYVGYDYENEDFTNPQSENVKKLIKYLYNK